MSFELRPYTDADEQGWLRCRVLGFLDSAFYDDVRQEKEHYAGPAIQLVAVADTQIVGLLDLELDPAAGVLWNTDRRGGVYMQPDEARDEVTLRSEGLKPVLAFAHYTGDDPEAVRRRFRRVHDDVLFERPLLQG